MTEISVSREEGFADIEIPIKSVSFGNDGTARIVVEGGYKGKTVGLELTVKGHMRAGIVKDDVDTTAFYERGIIVRLRENSGAATMFASQYGVQPEPKAPLQAIELTCIALDGNPSHLESEHVNFKVFHDDNDALGLYFEMYLHVDIPCRYIRFDEKDEEYRTNIASTFAAVESFQRSRLS